MPLPQFVINPYVQPSPGSITPEFKQAIGERVNQYNQNAEYDDVLGYATDSLLQNVSPFEGDINYAKQIMDESRQSIADRASKGDYENMTREVKRAARTFEGKVQPLLENQKRYSAYLNQMEDLYKTGKISLDTYGRAKNASLQGYGGLDPNNITGSYFRGFTPGADVNVADKVNKYLEGWKADGNAKIIPDGQGGFTKVSWENADENDIERASQEFLKGDSEFGSYYQTQSVLQNTDRVNREVSDAISAGTRKYGFYKRDIDLKWEPEYINNNKNLLELARNLPMVNSTATVNPGAVNVFDGQGLKTDDLTGKKILNDKVSQENGKYYMFKDKGGNLVTKGDYLNAESAKEASKSSYGAAKIGMSENPYTKTEVSQEQALRLTTEANKLLVDMAGQLFLREAVKSGKINTILGDDAAVADYLRINQGRFTSKDYLKETSRLYDDAIKNTQQINDNKRWDIGLIPGAVSPEFTKIEDDDALANLAGQSVGILDTDIGGFRKGQKADLNSMLDKLSDDGYVVSGFKKLGPLQYNPYSDRPAMSYGVMLKDSDGKKKVMEIAAAMNDEELQPVQDVYNLKYKGMSGDVPFYAPNTIRGALQGRFRVRTAPETIDGKTVFSSYVDILDTNGNKLKGAPQQIPMEHFGDLYQQIFAPNLLTKYLNPKYR